MTARALSGGLLACLCACPAPHDLIGRRCAVDSDCGEGLVCHRLACATAGSFETVTLVLDSAADEGGALLSPARISRAPVQTSLVASASGAALPSARAEAAAAAGFIVGGTGSPAVLVAATRASTTPLPSARAAAGASAAGGRLFVLGGRAADDSLLAEALSALIHGDGGLGAWESEPALPGPRAGLSSVAAGGFVYAIGGESAAGLSRDVLAAPISGSGRLGPWQSAGQLPQGRARFGAATFDGRLYLAGGACGGASCPALRAALLPDGGLGAFEPLALLVPDREAPAVALSGGALHVIGGRLSGGGLLDEVRSLPLTDVPAPEWLTSPRLPARRVAAVAVASADGVTLLGGRAADGGTLGDAIELTATRGGLEAFADSELLPNVTESAGAVTWGGALYSIGGTQNGAPPLDAIFRTALAPDGGLLPWSRAGTLPARRGDVGAAAWGGRLYVVGGCGPAGTGGTECLSEREIWSAPLLADGGVGAFRSEGLLDDDIAGLRVAIVSGRLYAVGGVTGYNPTRKDVFVSAIDPVTLALGPFTRTTPLPLTDGGVWGHALVAARGMLYVVGGENEGGFGSYFDAVYAARLAADGTVGAWSVAARLPEERGRVAAVAFDDTLFVATGCNEPPDYCSHYLLDVLSAPLLEDGGIGRFSSLTRHDPRRAMTLAVLEGQLIAFGGYDGNVRDAADVARLHGRGALGPASALAGVQAGALAVAGLGSSVYAIGGDGSVTVSRGLGAFVAGQSLPMPSTKPAAAAARGRVYVVSGDSVWSGVDDWRSEAKLARAQMDPSLAASPGALYLTDGSSLVFALLAADGTVGAWQMGPALPQPFGHHRSLVARGHLFVLDGDTGSVLAAKLRADGNVGEWRRADGLDGPRAAFGAAYSDGMLYATGGVDVSAAPVHDDGTLGSWAHVGTLRSPALSLTAASGALVSLSGGGGAAMLALRAAPERAAFSVRVDLGSAVREVEALSLEGNGPVEVDVRLAGDDGTFGPWRTLGDELAVGAPAHYLWLRVRLFGDASVTGLSVSTKL